MIQRCAECAASLSYLVGDASPYELIDPLEGGPKVLVPHTEERCRFHRFLTPELGAPLAAGEPVRAQELLTTGAYAGAGSPARSGSRSGARRERWVRTDLPAH